MKTLLDQYNLITEKASSQKVSNTGPMSKQGDFIEGGAKHANAGANKGKAPAPKKKTDDPSCEDGKPHKEHVSTMKIDELIPKSSFDELFTKALTEEFGEEAPLEQTGEGEFDDETGDFPELDGEGGDDLEEEVDVATKLRMIIEQLEEIAEAVGAYDSEGEEDEMGDEMDGVEDEFDFTGEPGSEPPVGESVHAGGKTIDGKGKPHPAKSYSAKGVTVNPSSVAGRQTGKGHPKSKGRIKDTSGKVKPLPDGKGSRMSKSNQHVRGKAGNAGSSIFD